MSVVHLASYRRPRPTGSIKAVGPELADIMDALFHNGGALHRSEVARQVGDWRGLRAREDISALERDLDLAFQSYLAAAESRKQPPLLFQPFGPRSYRWALTDAGRTLLMDQHVSRHRTR